MVLAAALVWLPVDPTGAANPPVPPIRVYGQQSSFMFLNTTHATESGHLAIGVPVDGWRYDAATDRGWRKGTSAWFAERTGRGRIVIGTMPLTINQTKSTMKTMSVAVFDPATETFDALKVPTDKAPGPGGALTYEAANPGKSGGADVSDLCIVDVDPDPAVDDERVLAISYLPYKNWDPTLFGKFPGVLSLTDDGSAGATAVREDASHTKRPEQLRATLPPTPEAVPPAIEDLAFPLKPSAVPAYGLYASTVGANECAVLPSGDVVITQYGLDPDHFPGTKSGRLVVLGPDGTVKDFVQLENYETPVPVRAVPLNATPPYVAPAGTPLRMMPREVQADPGVAADGTSRFTVLFDALIEDGANLDQAPFPVQEFSWDGTHVRARSAPIEIGDDPGVPMDLTAKRASFSRLAYAPDGTLFAAQVEFNGAAGGGPFAQDLVAFRRGTLERTPPVDPAPGARRSDYGLEALPDVRVHEATWQPSFPPANRPIRSTRSILFDDAAQRLYTVSWRGELRGYEWHGTSAPPTVLCDVDLGVTKLVRDPNNDRIVQGVLDPVARTMYVPYERRGNKLPDEVVDQYLFAVDVDRALTTTRPTEDATCDPWVEPTSTTTSTSTSTSSSTSTSTPDTTTTTVPDTTTTTAPDTTTTTSTLPDTTTTSSTVPDTTTSTVPDTTTSTVPDTTTSSTVPDTTTSTAEDTTTTTTVVDPTTAPPTSTSTTAPEPTTQPSSTLPGNGGPIDVGAQQDPDTDDRGGATTTTAARVGAAGAGRVPPGALPRSGTDAATPSFTGSALILGGVVLVLVGALARRRARR